MPRPGRCTGKALEIPKSSWPGAYLDGDLPNQSGFLEFDLGNIQEAKRFGQLSYATDVKAFSQILSFGSEDQRLAYQRLQIPTRSLSRWAKAILSGRCGSSLQGGRTRLDHRRPLTRGDRQRRGQTGIWLRIECQEANCSAALVKDNERLLPRRP